MSILMTKAFQRFPFMLQKSNSCSPGTVRQSFDAEKQLPAQSDVGDSPEELDRSEKGSISRLLFHTAAIVFCYSIYALLGGTAAMAGFMLERITQTRHGPDGERFNTYFMLLFRDCFEHARSTTFFNFGVARFALLIRKQDDKAFVPQQNYMLVATTYVGAMYGSSTALKFVSYPTQVVAKSCKMIPVMLMGVALGKKYSRIKYLCVGMITIGVAMFVMKPQSGNTQNSVVGLMLLAFSLLCDGFTSAFEEKVVSMHNPSALQMMVYTNLYGSLLTFTCAQARGEVGAAVAFFNNYPEAARDVLLYAVAGACGQLFVFKTIREFGALVCSTATTLRKFFNVVWSIAYFGHEVFLAQGLGAALVFSGLCLDLHSRHSNSK